MATQNSFAEIATVRLVSRTRRSRQTARPRPRYVSREEADRREDAEQCEAARLTAMARATRAVDISTGVVWFTTWADLVRTRLPGYRVSESRLVDGFRALYGKRLTDRMVMQFSSWGRASAEVSFWGGRLCVRAYLQVPVAKLALTGVTAAERRYFDE